MDHTRNMEFNHFTFEEVFDIEEIQVLQDSFSAVTGVASIITYPNGTPITAPSRFTSLCSNVIRKTEKGLQSCKFSHADLDEPNSHGPKIKPCQSCGLMCGSASIVVDGKHIGNWIIGQVITEEISEDNMMAYADRIGADRDLFKSEFLKVQRMSSEQFSGMCKHLFLNAQMLTKYAHKTQELSAVVQIKKSVEDQLSETFKQIEATDEELIAIEEEVREQSEKLREKELAILEVNQALDKSETHYRSLFNTLVSGYAVHEMIFDAFGNPCDYIFIDVNPSFEKLTGLQKENIIGKGIMEIMPSFEPTWLEAFGHVVRTGQMIELEEYSVAIGKYFNVCAFYHQENQFAVLFTDITERINDQKRLRESEWKYRAIVENMPCGIVNFDCHGEIIGSNAVFADLMALSINELVGSNMFSLNNLDMKEVVKTCLLGELSNFKGVYRSTGNGQSKIISAILTPVLDEQNKVKSGQALVFDISELNEIEQKLIKQTETLKALFKNSPNGIVQFDDKQCAVDVNDAFCTLFGYKIEETIGVEVDLLIAKKTDQHKVRVHTEILLSGESVNLKEKRSGKNQKEIMMNIIGVPVIYEGKVIGGFGVYTDLTEEESVKQTLIEAKDKSELAQRIMTDFLANMSHEIRTPLNGLLGMIQLLQLTPLEEDQREYLEVSRTASESLLSVVNGILDYTKIESGRLSDVSVEFDLRKLIQDTESLFKPMAIKKQIKLCSSIDETIPTKIMGDEFKLKQVLSNLVGNAVKFTHKGAVNITVKQVMSKDLVNAQLEFCIADTGIGIPTEKRHLLFERFSQIDSSNTRAFSGSGLGLAISKGLVVHMGGDIWVESEKNRGSQFYFTFPVHFKSNYITMLESESDIISNLSTTFNSRLLRILVAEDDLINQMVLSEIFVKQGWEVTTVDNGLQAIEEFKNKSFDIIVMDCQMPELDGYETTKRIRSLESGSNKIPIIAITASVLAGDQEKCIEAGMTVYFGKPIIFKELIGYLKSYEGVQQLQW